MPVNLIILIAAVVVAVLIFRALLSLLKTFLTTAIAIIVIVLILRIFGFSPQDLMHEIVNLPQIIKHLGNGNK
ncbi:MAG: hypothetical protein PUP90_09955 [Nostoc sp. S4]|nr:hypothetical protein [Nostoc sp. S4]